MHGSYWRPHRLVHLPNNASIEKQRAKLVFNNSGPSACFAVPAEFCLINHSVATSIDQMQTIILQGSRAGGPSSCTGKTWESIILASKTTEKVRFHKGKETPFDWRPVDKQSDISV